MTRRPRRPRYTRLILLSGGIDSTYQLAKFLQETDDIIIAHHVHLINKEGRHDAEAEACRQVVEYCRSNFRDFIYSESTIDRSGLDAFGYDVITVASEGGIAASNYLLKTGMMPDFWTLGLNKEEAEEVSTADSVRKSSGAVQQSRLTFLLAAMAATCYPNKPPKYLRPAVIPKREQMEYMGQKLVDLCWTCRRPIPSGNGFKECGVCETCELVQSIKCESLFSRTRVC